MTTILEADEHAHGMRLDQWLAGEMAPDYSRSRLQSLIKEGAVSLNGKPVLEIKKKLKFEDKIEISLPPAVDANPKGENIELNILYEDDALIVVNKPAGMVVHPGNGNATGTLVNALIYHCGDTLSGIGGVKRPGIVHRLDKDTSGTMVVAKTDICHRELSNAFADHGRSGDLERCYYAVVWGTPNRKKGLVETYLGRAAFDRTKRAVVGEGARDGRHAVTHFEVLDTYGDDGKGDPMASLVACELETGRTHQIRVHMAHIGHPLIGDGVYGQAFFTKANRLPEELGELVRNFNRQALHAQLLAFRHPIKDEIMRFDADPPSDMAKLIMKFSEL